MITGLTTFKHVFLTLAFNFFIFTVCNSQNTPPVYTPVADDSTDWDAQNTPPVISPVADDNTDCGIQNTPSVNIPAADDNLECYIHKVTPIKNLQTTIKGILTS